MFGWWTRAAKQNPPPPTPILLTSFLNSLAGNAKSQKSALEYETQTPEPGRPYSFGASRGVLIRGGTLTGEGCVCVCVGGGWCSFTDFGKFFNIWYPLYFIGAPDFSEMFEVYTILRQVHELLCKCRESSMYINGISFDHITSRQ